ncbi:MAG TPA: hypothetical protein VEA60_11875 [Allosphingosinicella sp.]|nr:hypothetical protein [Allosphingosinicella sp.]
MIASAPDTACSRLLCPRKLKPRTGYHAFLMPAFESGRLAGLGVDPGPFFADPANALTATSSAWGNYAVPANRPEGSYFPFYHRWYFRTAEEGDFESLVRLLKPKVVDSRVGHRDMDVTDPAPNITGIEDPDLGGVLRLGGALRAPLTTLNTAQRLEYDRYDGWATPYPHPFQTQLAAFINLSVSYQEEGVSANADGALDAVINANPDPLITPPAYGRWHALTERLLTEPDGSPVDNAANWLHDLNLDPRWRVAAGFGTKVVQQHQESYMEAAWEQIGDVIEANRRIRHAQLARHSGRQLHRRHLAAKAATSSAGLLTLHAPVAARVVSQGLTVRHRLRQSPIGVALTSTAMRRTMRPGGKAAKRLGLTAPDEAGALVERANEGAISAAPPKLPPDRILSPGDLAGGAAPPTFGGVFLDTAFRRNPILSALVVLAIILLILFLLGFGALAWAAAGLLLLLLFALWRQAQPALAVEDLVGSLSAEDFTPAAVDRLAGSAAFTPVVTADPRSPDLPRPPRPGGDDNPAGDRFKAALKDQYRAIEVSGAVSQRPPLVPLDLPVVAGDILAGLDPAVTVPRWTMSGISLPPRVRDQIGEAFVEAMAYPELDIPMYEPLEKAGTDYFVPNLHLVEPDSVTLLETNQRFIEAYMVGLNHEFARELLWREYPTDQRGSYFRQFWDVRKKIAEAADKEAARETFKDIKPLHLWPPDNDLGDNDNREEGPEPEEELVLVIRGELLKKYPNTIVSAQPAKWHANAGGTPDKSKERELDDTRPAIFPLYEAKAAPDIYFFGFDLTAIAARGDDSVDDKPGWFFRIEEVPGDTRFGFDISRESVDVNVWNDLAWPDVAPGLVDGETLRVSGIPARTLVKPTGPLSEKLEQWESDKLVPLDADVSAAELAYIAVQTPVIMAVHASELLPDQES